MFIKKLLAALFHYLYIHVCMYVTVTQEKLDIPAMIRPIHLKSSNLENKAISRPTEEIPI